MPHDSRIAGWPRTNRLARSDLECGGLSPLYFTREEAPTSRRTPNDLLIIKPWAFALDYFFSGCGAKPARYASHPHPTSRRGRGAGAGGSDTQSFDKHAF